MPKKFVLIFGEDQTDSKAIKQLCECLRHDLNVQIRRRPIILEKGADRQKQKNQFQAVAGIVRSTSPAVNAVILHRDCDAVEPAHVALSQAIEDAARRALPHGVKVVAATPAFELEAWWYLFPEAVAKYRPKWRPLERHGENVGMISDAKKQLIRDLRPAGGARVRDYSGSDAPGIAEKVRALGLCRRPVARSASFTMFTTKIASL